MEMYFIVKTYLILHLLGARLYLGGMVLSGHVILMVTQFRRLTLFARGHIVMIHEWVTLI